MKRLALLMLPILALTSCNSSASSKPTGKKVSKDEFMEAAKKAKRTGEDEYVTKIEISGNYTIEIFNTSYPEDASKTTLSGTVTITNSASGQELNMDNVKVKGDYPVVDPFTNAYHAGLFTPEQNKERLASRFANNTAIGFGIFFVRQLAVSADPYIEQLINQRFTDDACSFYTNPFEIAYEPNLGETEKNYELVRFDSDGVLSAGYTEASGQKHNARDDDRNKHEFDYRIKCNQSIKITTEKM